MQIFHTSVDKGSFKERMGEIIEKQFGKFELQRHKENIEKFWEELDKALEKRIKGIDIRKVKIYQDAQVVNGPVGIKIVEEIAERGSKNHQIILKLIRKGAVLMKTESFEALKEEYFLIKAMITAKTSAEEECAAMEYEKRKDDILRKRDRYIARNIDKTLKEGEIGILFIGASHNVENELPSSIRIEHLENANIRQLKDEIMSVSILRNRL